MRTPTAPRRGGAVRTRSVRPTGHPLLAHGAQRLRPALRPLRPTASPAGRSLLPRTVPALCPHCARPGGAGRSRATPSRPQAGSLCFEAAHGPARPGAPAAWPRPPAQSGLAARESQPAVVPLVLVLRPVHGQPASRRPGRHQLRPTPTPFRKAAGKRRPVTACWGRGRRGYQASGRHTTHLASICPIPAPPRAPSPRGGLGCVESRG